MKSFLDIPVACGVEVLNGGLFVSRGEGVHRTRRIDSYELIFVRRGCLAMWEEKTDFEIHAGQTLILWPGRKHGGARRYDPDLSFYWIHFNLPGQSKRKSGGMHLVQHQQLARPERLEQLFRRFLDDQETGRPDKPEGDLLMALMLCEVARKEEAAVRVSDTVAALAQRADQWIQLHSARPISTADVARALSCNADYLGRMYRCVFDCTIVEAIHRCRIRIAKADLMETNDTIQQIAHSCGFEDPGYFRRVFRRIEGMSPRRYRQLHARMHVITR